jgi:putative transposase
VLLLPELPSRPQHLFQEVHCRAVFESTLERWRNRYGGMKSEESKRLKTLEDENRRLKQIVADQALDIQMLKHLSEGNW